MLRAFWDAAVRLDPDAPDEARVLRFGRAGELAALFTRAGLHEVEESTLTVGTAYVSFEELWSTFLAGIGPAGAYVVGLPPERRAALRAALADALGRPAGAFRLEAVARVARGVVVASERLATGPGRGARRGSPPMTGAGLAGARRSRDSTRVLGRFAVVTPAARWLRGVR